jgi:HEAT repeat protein
MYENAFTPLEPLDELDSCAPPLPDPEVMLAQLQQPNPTLRMQAARAFCDIEEPRAVDSLVELLQDSCALVRVSAAYALGRNTASRIVLPLVRSLQTDWNGYVRKGVVWALGNARDRRAVPALIDALQHDITAVRLWSASALGQMEIESAVEPLLAALVADPVAAVRSNCAWSLGRLTAQLPPSERGDRVVRQLIQVLYQDRDGGVRDDARDALLKLADPRGLEAIAELDADPLATLEFE